MYVTSVFCPSVGQDADGLVLAAPDACNSMLFLSYQKTGTVAYCYDEKSAAKTNDDTKRFHHFITKVNIDWHARKYITREFGRELLKIA